VLLKVKKVIERDIECFGRFDNIQQGILLYESIWNILRDTEGLLHVDFSGLKEVEYGPMERSIGYIHEIPECRERIKLVNFESSEFAHLAKKVIEVHSRRTDLRTYKDRLERGV
jgi:hypothetical protein